MASRRLNIVLWSLFAGFLLVVMVTSFDVSQVRCEVCVKHEGTTECAAGAGANREDAVTAATTGACERLLGTTERPGGPRVRPEIDAASRCIDAVPHSVSCEAG